MMIIELKLSTAIKEAGDIEDVRLSKEDAEYILELLKKQEPIQVKDIAEEIIGHKPKVKVGHCPCCGQLLNESSRYCSQCGQAVKWNA